MNELDIALALIGLTVVAVGLLSNRIKRGWVQSPLIAVAAGFAAGPQGLGWLMPAGWGDENAILEAAARITLAIGLMGVALRLERDCLAEIWRPVALLLVAGMLGMWLAASALAGWLLGLGLWAALLLGAVVTPTDPVVASTIVTGSLAEESLPARLRQALSFESGANDGLALPFVMLPVLVIQHGEAGWGRWLLEGLVGGVLWAAVLGAAIGRAAAWALVKAEATRSVDNVSLLGYSVAFTLATLGAAELLGANGIIAVFVAGAVFSFTAPPREEHEEAAVQEAVARLFTLPMFVIFGAALPVEAWLRLGWPLAALALAVLLLRRPPVVALLVPGLRPLMPRDGAFLGWFGPIGVAAIYYATYARGQLDDAIYWEAGSALVLASIVAHGISAAPLTRAYARLSRGGR